MGGKRRGFPSGFRRLVVDEKIYFFRVGDQNTVVRTLSGKRKVFGNWTLKGMDKKAWLATRWTQGTDEFQREDGCQCWRCDCDMHHLRYSHMVYPSDIANAVREWK